MIDEMVFDPIDLRTLGLVFDEAWNCLLAQHPECAMSPGDASSARIGGASFGK